jgi:hypothetical protein
MWRHPSMPIAPPMTVPSVQNAMVRTPLTVPAAASTPERSRFVQKLDTAVVEERAEAKHRVAGRATRRPSLGP